MNQTAKEELDRITAISPEGLSDAEIDFMYARREYLTKAQKSEYGDLLKAKEKRVEKAANPDKEA